MGRILRKLGRVIPLFVFGGGLLLNFSLLRPLEHAGATGQASPVLLSPRDAPEFRAAQQATAGLGGVGFDMEVDPVRQQLYVSIPSLNQVAIISLSTLEIVDRITLGGKRPQGMDLGLDGDTLYVALNQAGAVAAIDLRTKAVTEIVVAGEVGNSLIYDVLEGKPNRLYVSADPGSAGFAYLALVKLDQGNAVSRIESGGIIRARPELLASADRRFLYVGEDFSPESLYKFDITTDTPPKVLEDQHGTISGTDRFDVSPDGLRIYLRSGQVLRTDSFSQAGGIAGGVPKVSRDGGLLYVGSDNIIEVYDRLALVKADELTTGCTADRIELGPDGSALFVLGGDAVCRVLSVESYQSYLPFVARNRMSCPGQPVLAVFPTSQPLNQTETDFAFQGSCFTPNGALPRWFVDPLGSMRDLAPITADSAGGFLRILSLTGEWSLGTYTYYAQDGATGRTASVNFAIVAPTGAQQSQPSRRDTPQGRPDRGLQEYEEQVIP